MDLVTPQRSFGAQGARNASALHRSSRISQAVLLAADILAFFASFYVAMALVDRNWDLHNFKALIFGSAWLSIGLWIVIFARLGMYKPSAALSARDEVYYTIAALAIGITPELLLFTIVPALSTSRLLLVVAAACAILAVGGARAVIRPAIKAIERGDADNRVLVVTFDDGANAKSLVRDEKRVAHYASNVDPDDESPRGVLERLAWFRAAATENCEAVIISALLNPQAANHVFELGERYGMRVAFAPPQLRRSAYDVRIERDWSRTVLTPVPLSIVSPAADFCKSLFDRACAMIALVLLAPVLLTIAIAIRAEGPGPIFFRQERVGRGNRNFRIFKFRSMHVDAGSAWAAHGDDRITRVGRFIRRFSLDELPQFINVLRGEMSLVGPRPEMREYAERFAKYLPRYPQRHIVRPGITGWTQINMRRHLTTDDAADVLENDLFYIENWSFLLDLSILLKTASEFLFHRGV
jgi:exopolysaccharide biosynthesis polyprenyl glycosylphosphotransferase